jgi:hypothetical protein
MPKQPGQIEAAIGKVVLDCRRAIQLQITLAEMELPPAWREHIVLLMPPPGKWRRPVISDPGVNIQHIINSCKAYVRVVAPKPE